MVIKKFESFNDKNDIKDILNIASDEGLVIIYSETNDLSNCTRVYISLYPGDFRLKNPIVSNDRFIEIIKEIRNRLGNEGFLKVKKKLRLKKKRMFDIFNPKEYEVEESEDIPILCWTNYPMDDDVWLDHHYSTGELPTHHKYTLLDNYPDGDYTLPQEAVIDLNVKIVN